MTTVQNVLDRRDDKVVANGNWFWHDRPMPFQGDPNKLKAHEVATLLNLPRYRVLELARTGELRRIVPPTYKYGYFDLQDVLAYKRKLDEQREAIERERQIASDQ